MNDVGAFIGYAVGIIGTLFTASNLIYNRTKDAKKDGKECAVDTTTVIVKLESIQATMNQLIGSMTSMQAKFENFDHRLTMVEAQLKYGRADIKAIDI